MRSLACSLAPNLENHYNAQRFNHQFQSAMGIAGAKARLDCRLKEHMGIALPRIVHRARSWSIMINANGNVIYKRYPREEGSL